MEDPGAIIDQVAGAYLTARCLHVVADLGIADALGEETASVEEIASGVGADPQALRRIVHHLASQGIFEVRDGELAHTAASRLLRGDHPDSLLPVVQLLGLPILWDSFRELQATAKTGRPGAEIRDPAGFFGYLSAHDDESDLYDRGMTAMTERQIAQVVPAYDFSRFKVIADIAGGQGGLLRAVLDQVPGASGILFDQPHVLDGVEPHERLTLHPGDFFHDPLPAADCYLLKSIIHDWGDSEAATILSTVRDACPDDASLLLIEYVVPEEGDTFAATDIDIFMLALVTGRERTRREYDALLGSSGFELVRTIPTPRLTIIEARPVPA